MPAKHMSDQQQEIASSVYFEVDSTALRGTKARSEEPWSPFRINDIIKAPKLGPDHLPQSHPYPVETSGLEPTTITNNGAKHPSRLPEPVKRKVDGL